MQTIDHLIQTGNSEQIFVAAIEGHGRVQVASDTFTALKVRDISFLLINQMTFSLFTYNVDNGYIGRDSRET